MSITHIQETSCYCCQCNETILLAKVRVPDGAEFAKYNPETFGWKSFILKGNLHYLCPKHILGILITIDGQPYPQTP